LYITLLIFLIVEQSNDAQFRKKRKKEISAKNLKKKGRQVVLIIGSFVIYLILGLIFIPWLSFTFKPCVILQKEKKMELKQKEVKRTARNVTLFFLYLLLFGC
jgi:dipeptide/tripeptide permease